MKKKKYLRIPNLILYFLAFCALFFAGTFIAFTDLFAEGKTLIWSTDGIPQYLLWLQYTGEYLRNLFKDIMAGNYITKMYDFTIGMGGDVRSFFRLEFIPFLGVFFKEIHQLTDLYNILTIFRMFLIGLAFSCYGFYKKKPYPAVLAASITYTLSAYSFYHVARHPQFAVGIMLLPLLLIGLEQVMKKQNVLFFSFMVAIALTNSYYFLYINTIIMGLYVLIRIRGIYREHTINELFAAVFRIMLAYLLGCGMAAVFFLPTIVKYFLSSRDGAGSTINMIGDLWSYGSDRLPRLFLFMVAPIDHDLTGTSINTSILAVPAVAMLFGEKITRKLSLKISFILGMIMLSIPVVAYIFSGFDQVVNRWSYAFIFLLAVIILFEFENFMQMNPVQLLLMIGFLVLYYFDWQFINAESPRYRLGFIFLRATVIVIVLMRYIPRFPKKLASVILCLIVGLSTAVNGYVDFNKDYGRLATDYVYETSAERHFEESIYKTFADIEDDSFYRCDTNLQKNDNYNNASTALKYNGIGIYNSIINENVIDYFLEGENIGISGNNRTMSLDGRISAEALACVKYYIAQSETKHMAPYGFEKKQEILNREVKYNLYENPNVLPLGYTYDQYMKRSTYMKLGPLEKQQAMLKCAIVDDKDVENIFDELTASGVLPYEVMKGESLQITSVDEGIAPIEGGYDYQLIIPEEKQDKTIEYPEKSKIHFSLPSKAGCEVYLRFRNLSYGKGDRSELKITTDHFAKSLVVRNEKDTYSLHRSDYLVNLGYYDSEETIDGTICFLLKGPYSWDDIEVFYVSMDNYLTDMASLKEESLTDVKITDNKVTGTIDSSKNQILTFSINYDPGWSIKVDGKKTDLYRINTMYMGIPITPGTHSIELNYESYGIRQGAMISLGSTLVFIILLFVWIMKKIVGLATRKKSDESEDPVVEESNDEEPVEEIITEEKID